VFKPLDLHGRYPQQGRRWGSPDLELEGMREDTRHEIYTGSGSQSSVPYVLFGVVLRPALGLFPGGIVDDRLGTQPSFI
jgi:hypothetical protein